MTNLIWTFMVKNQILLRNENFCVLLSITCLNFNYMLLIKYVFFSWYFLMVNFIWVDLDRFHKRDLGELPLQKVYLLHINFEKYMQSNFLHFNLIYVLTLAPFEWKSFFCNERILPGLFVKSSIVNLTTMKTTIETTIPIYFRLETSRGGCEVNFT